MIKLTYLTKEKKKKEMIFPETALTVIWYDIFRILDEGATNLKVFKIKIK